MLGAKLLIQNLQRDDTPIVLGRTSAGFTSLSGCFRPARLISICKILLLAVVGLSAVGCTTFKAEEAPLRLKYLPRWSLNEESYDHEDVGRIEKAGRNVRDGAVRFVNSGFQGVTSVFLVASTTGFAVQKLATMGGDVIGLVDDNAYTEHIFKGIISRQLLKFGAAGKGFVPAVSGMHERAFTVPGPKLNTLDYIGNKTFHTTVYGKPSAITSLVGIVVADFLIRPVGSIVMMVGARKTGEKIDKAGLDLIQKSLEVPFF